MIHLFDEDKLKAVAYYRFSAEDKQENSIENQREELEKKAEAEDIQIVESFEDEGVTGLIFERPGFQALMNKYVYAETTPDIDYLLIYDASRLSRVQRNSLTWRLIADLEDKNIRLGSVQRGIPAKGRMSVIESIIWTLDFAMASENSSLLSSKVILGCLKVAKQGYSAGGCPPYGYVRILLDEKRKRKQILPPGVHKEVSNQRVSFEPSKTGEAKVVKRIFDEFVNKNMFPDDIAESLNKDGIPTAQKKTWNGSTIIRILTNETYTGTRVYNKTWGRLKEQKRINPPEDWVRCLNAHKALIDTETFHKAKERLYWLRPRMRNKYATQITEVEKYVWKYVDEAISDLTSDQQLFVKQNLPIVFGTRYIEDSRFDSCFYIPTAIKKYGAVLACEVDFSTGKGNLNNMYCVPTEGIDCNNYLILDEQSESRTIKQSQLKDVIFELVEKLLEVHAPWTAKISVHLPPVGA